MSFSEDLDAQRAKVMRAVRQASTDWAEAMRAHKLAPPDSGFTGRLRALSDAAGREQVAWEHAHAAGLLWRPIPGAENAEPPSAKAWDESIAAFRRDRADLAALTVDEKTDLTARVPNGDGQTYLREVLLVADHTAYHVGELIVLRRLLGAWPA